jgi:pimeloyl-ACP methyl ester carboxylesterase
VVGEGPPDLVLVPGWVSNIEVFWEHPAAAGFLRRLASFSRLILFDKRGTGLSDRVANIPNIETRMDDVRAVMDAVKSERAVLFGYSEGGPMCAVFAATYPSRAAGLVMHGSYARLARAPDYPWGRTPEDSKRFEEMCAREWGGPVGLDLRAPSMIHDESFRQWWARFVRMGVSPAGNSEIIRMNVQIDVRHVLPSIRVPTLILHSVGDQTSELALGRYLARHIPGARLVEMPGIDHLGDTAEQALRSRLSRGRCRNRRSPTACSRQSCSPTSWDRPSARWSWAIVAGGSCSEIFTRRCVESWRGFAGARSTRLATASSLPSTGRHGPFAAPAPWGRR